MALFSPHGTVCVFMYFMLIQCETVRWGFAKSRSPCASRPHEGGRAASEVDHHARLLAGERGRNEPEGLLEEGTSRRDFSKGLFEGTFQMCCHLNKSSNPQ